MFRARSGIFIVLTLSCTGCGASLHGTCSNGDWYKIGRQDGAEGKIATRHFHHRAKVCGSFKIAADEPAYLKGRLAGLKEYCTIGGMYGHGILGNPYRPVCAKKSEPLFRLAYRWGKKASPVVIQLTKVQGAIRDADDQLHESGLKPKRINRIEEEIERLEAERARLKLELDHIQRLASGEIGELQIRLHKTKTDLSRHSIHRSNPRQ